MVRVWYQQIVNTDISKLLIRIQEFHCEVDGNSKFKTDYGLVAFTANKFLRKASNT